MPAEHASEGAVTDDKLLWLYEDRVRSEWIDYNGHLNEAYYLLIFSYATDAFMDFVGIDAAMRRKTNTSVYTLETHITYIQEVGEGEGVKVATQLIDFDQKRFHLFHTLHHGISGERLSTAECMLLNIDMSGPRATPFCEAILTRLQTVSDEQAALARPEEAGRSIGIRRRG